MPLDYAPHEPSTTSTHDHVYTALLGVLLACVTIGMLALHRLAHRIPYDPGQQAALRLVLTIEALWAGLMALVLAIRLLFPAWRRWPTIGFNIILLLFVPIGTALAVYGLWKVDRQLRRRMPNDY
jgi:uncharacterized membrane protein YidH (DUF202 family)